MSSYGQNTDTTTTHRPRLGIIGGSGLCSFNELETIEKIRPNTKYGPPSDDIRICKVGSETLAFLPRHGSLHSIAPHKVPYKANLQALKDIGVEHVIGTCISGSLKSEIPPGSIVIPDQFVNLTWGRDDFVDSDNGAFIHLPMGEPYCKSLRKMIASLTINTTAVFSAATVAVIQGPRFSTTAESRWLSSNGWDIVNMTQYPECYLAKEIGLCYAVIASVTDYDIGLKKNLTFGHDNIDAILEIFQSNIKNTKNIILEFAKKFSPTFSCGCASHSIKAYYENYI